MNNENYPENHDFSEIVAQGRIATETNEFKSEVWSWLRQLDDEGIFIFTYLFQDFREGLLNTMKLEEAVYTLSMLLHKMLPDALNPNLSQMDRFHIIFSLYERMKMEEMSWEASEEFVANGVAKIERNSSKIA